MVSSASQYIQDAEKVISGALAASITDRQYAVHIHVQTFEEFTTINNSSNMMFILDQISSGNQKLDIPSVTMMIRSKSIITPTDMLAAHNFARYLAPGSNDGYRNYTTHLCKLDQQMSEIFLVVKIPKPSIQVPLYITHQGGQDYHLALQSIKALLEQTFLTELGQTNDLIADPKYTTRNVQNFLPSVPNVTYNTQRELLEDNQLPIDFLSKPMSAYFMGDKEPDFNFFHSVPKPRNTML